MRSREGAEMDLKTNDPERQRRAIGLLLLDIRDAMAVDVANRATLLAIQKRLDAQNSPDMHKTQEPPPDPQPGEYWWANPDGMEAGVLQARYYADGYPEVVYIQKPMLDDNEAEEKIRCFIEILAKTERTSVNILDLMMELDLPAEQIERIMKKLESEGVTDDLVEELTRAATVEAEPEPVEHLTGTIYKIPEGGLLLMSTEPCRNCGHHVVRITTYPHGLICDRCLDRSPP